MKNLIALLAMLIMIIPANAALVTITVEGTTLNSLNLPVPVHYVFNYDKSLTAVLTTNETTNYLNDYNTDSMTVDFFYADFTGRFVLKDQNTSVANTMLNVGCVQLFGTDSSNTSLTAGYMYHYATITSKSIIDDWHIGTVVQGLECSLQYDGKYKYAVSDMEITSIVRSIPVPELSTASFSFLGVLCLIFIHSFRSKVKKVRNL